MKNLLLVFALIIISCGGPTKEKADLKSPELEKLEKSLDSLFNSEIKSVEPGAALLIAYDGKILIGKGYGLRDLETKQPITASTNMRMASVSKQFTALNILTLIDKGVLSLSDTVYNYLPYAIFKNRTIEHLINHTSGLPDYEKYFNENWDRSIVMENKNVLEWLATNPEPVFKPGEKWEYSNTAYLMLALIVEKVSGIEFSKYAKENVFKKASMINTNYFNLAQPIEIPERAFCYEIDSLGQIKKVDGFYMNGVMGDGAVYTSVNDYFQYDLALRNKTILSEATHELIFKPSSSLERNGVKQYYAMGWGIKDSTATHTGGWFGTNTIVKRDLYRPLTTAIFMNRNTLFRGDLIKKTDSILEVYMKEIEN